MTLIEFDFDAPLPTQSEELARRIALLGDTAANLRELADDFVGFRCEMALREAAHAMEDLRRTLRRTEASA